MQTTMKAEDFGQPEPRAFRVFIERERDLTLAELLRAGLKLPATHGPAVRVEFQAASPTKALAGWFQVAVRSSFGGTSTLLYEPEFGGRVSGLLRVRR